MSMFNVYVVINVNGNLIIEAIGEVTDEQFELLKTASELRTNIEPNCCGKSQRFRCLFHGISIDKVKKTGRPPINEEMVDKIIEKLENDEKTKKKKNTEKQTNSKEYNSDGNDSDGNDSDGNDLNGNDSDGNDLNDNDKVTVRVFFCSSDTRIIGNVTVHQYKLIEQATKDKKPFDFICYKQPQCQLCLTMGGTTISHVKITKDRPINTHLMDMLVNALEYKKVKEDLIKVKKSEVKKQAKSIKQTNRKKYNSDNDSDGNDSGGNDSDDSGKVKFVKKTKPRGPKVPKKINVYALINGRNGDETKSIGQVSENQYMLLKQAEENDDCFVCKCCDIPWCFLCNMGKRATISDVKKTEDLPVNTHMLIRLVEDLEYRENTVKENTVKENAVEKNTAEEQLDD